jgi:hypothetical protein
MTLIMILAILVVWAICGYVTYGLTLAYFDGEFPAQAWNHGPAHRPIARLVALGGPGGLVVALCCAFPWRHGLKWTPMTYDDVVTAHQKAYPSLDVEIWVPK